MPETSPVVAAGPNTQSPYQLDIDQVCPSSIRFVDRADRY
jgi:hypothetical protein